MSGMARTLLRPALIVTVAAFCAVGVAGTRRAEAETAVRVQVLDADPARVSVTAAAVPAPGLGAFTIDVLFDSERLAPVTCHAADGFFCNASFNTAGAAAVRCGGFDVTGRTGNVDLCDVSFSVRSSAASPSCARISVEIREFADASGAKIAAAGATSNVCAGNNQAASGAGDALHTGASPSGGEPGAADTDSAPAAPGAASSGEQAAGDRSAASDRGQASVQERDDPAAIAPVGAAQAAPRSQGQQAAAASQPNAEAGSRSPEGDSAGAPAAAGNGDGFDDWWKLGGAGTGLLAVLIAIGLAFRSARKQTGD